MEEALWQKNLPPLFYSYPNTYVAQAESIVFAPRLENSGASRHRRARWDASGAIRRDHASISPPSSRPFQYVTALICGFVSLLLTFFAGRKSIVALSGND